MQEKYIGKTSGFITLVSYDRETRLFTGKCRCGTEFQMTEMHAHRGSIHACPICLKKYFPHRTRDITGKRYGVWEVLYPAVEEDGKVHRKWRCRCTHCGFELDTTAGPLAGGLLFSCHKCGAGAIAYEPLLREFSLRGQRFGALEVRYNLSGSDMWACRCDCGNTESFTRDELLSHKFLDCGCGIADTKNE